MLAPIRADAQIGFIGLGNMGLPMAQRLAARGYAVRAYDVSEEARAQFAASSTAMLAESVYEAAQHCAAVILMLPNSDIVTRVVEEDGLLTAIPPGGLVIDMGSSDPLRTRELSARAAGLGVEFVDAPVSGGVAGAREGTLTVMFGGASDTARACEPLFKAISQRVFHVGEVGAGHAVKALNNLLSATSLLAASEAVHIGQRFGVDPTRMLEAINSSSGRSGSTEQKFPKFILTESYDSGFSLRLMLKDLRIALGLGDGLGLASPLSAEATRLWGIASEDLASEADHTEIARWASDKT